MEEEKTSKAYQVLIVEDQDIFAEYIEEILKRHGYTTVSFREPFRALDYLLQHGSDIDLILTDIVMPHMDGIELARRVARMRRDVPVILLSAYSEQLEEGAGLPNVRAVLGKPVMRADLLRAIDGVLRSREKQARRKTAFNPA